MNKLKLFASLLIACLPSWLKIPIYRNLFRFEIGKGVRIGPGVVFFRVSRCRIGEYTRIGPGNAFWGIDDLTIGKHGRIGFLNLFRGGNRIVLGDYLTILRGNVFNCILEPEATNPLDPVLELGAGVVITTGHWLDFSDRISIGPLSILGGRGSSIWTHNRQRTRPVTIGRNCYLGSEIRIAPGAVVGDYSIISLGSVLTGQFVTPRVLIGGNPAAVIRELNRRDLVLVTTKTRKDLPDALQEMRFEDYDEVSPSQTIDG